MYEDRLPRCSVRVPALVVTTSRSSLCGLTKSLMTASPVRADQPVTHLVMIAGHVAPGGTGDTVRELQFGGDPLVDTGVSFPLRAGRGDHGWFTAGVRREHALGMQAVTPQVHQRAAGQVE